MRYYVTADVHGYFSELESALANAGFFKDREPHKLIVCGDLYDRGGEAAKLQEFILDLLAKDQVILIRGNHEDLTMKLLYEWHLHSYQQSHHYANGTLDTICQLTGFCLRDIFTNPEAVGRAFWNNPYIKVIIPAMVDYYETDRYIFTHGWIPCTPDPTNRAAKEYLADWRNAGKETWDTARWINGMATAHSGIREPGKTIVCGHWHCSFGHCHYGNNGGEFDNDPVFTPYYGEGVIALDACTPASKMVNCIVIED